MIRAVLFDYGGTLVRPLKPWEEVKPAAFEVPYTLLCRRGLKKSYSEYEALDKSVFDRYYELETKTDSDIPDIKKYCELIDTLFPRNSKAWRERTAAKANRAFWDFAKANYVLQKGTLRCLSRLKSMKLRLAVISNHHDRKALTDHLSQLDVKSYFTRIIVSSSVGFRKPDPRIFAMCLSNLRVKPSEAVFVGDSIEYDVLGAKGAGMKTILISDDAHATQPEESDFAIASLAEVPRIVSSL